MASRVSDGGRKFQTYSNRSVDCHFPMVLPFHLSFEDPFDDLASSVVRPLCSLQLTSPLEWYHRSAVSKFGRVDRSMVNLWVTSRSVSHSVIVCVVWLVRIKKTIPSGRLYSN
jgi:hypothetical protein